jgi:hypothetical protein
VTSPDSSIGSVTSVPSSVVTVISEEPSSCSRARLRSPPDPEHLPLKVRVTGPKIVGIRIVKRQLDGQLDGQPPVGLNSSVP